MKKHKTAAKFAMGQVGRTPINQGLHRNLILVRHSLSDINPARSSSQWGLSEEGHARCIPLAEKLIAFQPTVIVASIEQKARETAAILAGHFDLQVTLAEGLHEHERGNVPYFETPEQFQTAISNLFNHPNDLVFGEETASQALTRYENAIRRVLLDYPDQTIVLVSHGTVMSLFVAHYNRLDAYEFWQKLTMPDVVVLSLPDFLITFLKP